VDRDKCKLSAFFNYRCCCFFPFFLFVSLLLVQILVTTQNVNEIKEMKLEELIAGGTVSQLKGDLVEPKTVHYRVNGFSAFRG
jgi:hypothetical protein